MLANLCLYQREMGWCFANIGDIIDGFSKLDEEQKKNVVTVIPQYAPQVIIFSKDPLEEFVDEDAIGKTWTIQSNDEKNYAIVKEGLLWK